MYSRAVIESQEESNKEYAVDLSGVIESRATESTAIARKKGKRRKRERREEREEKRKERNKERE